MKKVYIAGWSQDDARLMEECGLEVTQHEALADVILFTGGADVQPILYGEQNADSSCDCVRDERDIRIFRRSKDKIKLGICRGAQFLSVMAGGKLYQHLSGHNGPHLVYGEIPIGVNSFHHQGIRESDNYEALMIANCKEGIICEAIQGKDFFGVQWHPEWADGECREYFIRKVKEICK